MQCRGPILLIHHLYTLRWVYRGWFSMWAAAWWATGLVRALHDTGIGVTLLAGAWSSWRVRVCDSVSCCGLYPNRSSRAILCIRENGVGYVWHLNFSGWCHCKLWDFWVLAVCSPLLCGDTQLLVGEWLESERLPCWYDNCLERIISV